jgi:cytochrome P450
MAVDELAAKADATVEYFDHNSAQHGRERFEWYRTIREEKGPVFWSPHHGGYWVVIGWEELTEVARDWGTFSSKTQVEVDGVRYEGLFMPAQEGGSRMLQEDPPEWTLSRKTLASMFAPPAVELWRTRIQALVDACIDRRIETGRIDFVTDVARPVSAVFSLELTGLPAENFAKIAQTYGLASHLAADDPRWVDLIADFEVESERLVAAIEHQKTARQPCVITTLLDARDDGAAFSDADIADLARLVVGAGLDTTAALLGNTFVMLGDRPRVRQQLLDHPELMPAAIEEFLRYGTPTTGLCRTVTRDVELGGHQLRRGDRVMIAYAAAGRDPREFVDPDNVVLDRPANRHVAFGSGIHKCLGTHFARLEFESVLTTVLRRMPDFAINRDEVDAYDCVGVVAGWTSIPATFTPGPRIGADAGVPGWTP